MNIFGLNLITNIDHQLSLTAYLDGVNAGNQIFTTELNVANFFGIQDVGAFDRVVIDVFGPVNGAFASDDYRFEAASVPVSIALLGLGLAGLGFSRRKTKA